MKKLKIESWKVKLPDGNEMDENLLIALNVLINNKKPEEMPRGLDKFRIFAKIADAFEMADKTGTLELEDREYEFLKESIEKDIPSTWGGNKNLSKAVNAFLELKEG